MPRRALVVLLTGRWALVLGYEIARAALWEMGRRRDQLMDQLEVLESHLVSEFSWNLEDGLGLQRSLGELYGSSYLDQYEVTWTQIQRLERGIRDLLSNMERLEVNEDLIHGQEDEIVITDTTLMRL